MQREPTRPAHASAKERRLYRAFRIGLYIKGIDGALQGILGLALLIIKPATISHWLIVLTEQELFDDPQDFIANHLHDIAMNLSLGGKLFVSFYLLAHGALKIFIALTMLQDKHWAYKPALGALLVLIAYQVYRIGHTHSLVLIGFTLFDIAVAALIWHEYRYHIEEKKRLASQ